MKNKFLIILLIIFFIMSSNIFSDIICIDPGHGKDSNGNYTGAPGYNNQLPWEDQINIELAWAFEVKLEDYYNPSNIYVTRVDEYRFVDDIYLDVVARLEIAYGIRPDGYGRTIFPANSCDELVSVHCNASDTNPAAFGTSCIVYDATAPSGGNYPAADPTTRSYLLADEILHEYVNQTSTVFTNAKYWPSEAGAVVGHSIFYLTTLSTVPSTLFVESEFLSNSGSWVGLSDWYINSDWTYINAAGEGMASGCNNYSPVISSVEPEDPKHEISGFQLHENYPNPFNPTTTIKYDIEKATIVELEIFNTSGQLIKTLIKNHKSSGSYSAVWDGTNNNGFSVASGTYICRLRSADYSKSIKLALLR